MTAPRRYVALYAALALGVALLFPFLLNPNDALPAAGDAGMRAWLDAALFDAALRASLDRFGVIATQNPFVDGGMPLGAHPSDGTLSPLTLALLPLSPIGAAKWKTLAAIIVGTLALFSFARRAGASALASIAGALLLPASGFVRDRVASSPLDLQILFTAPAFGYVVAGDGRWTRGALAAALLALGAYQGGSLVLFALVALILAALFRMLMRPDERRPAGAGLGWLLLFTLLFAAAKWIPASELWTTSNVRAAALGHARDVVALPARADALFDLVAPGGFGWIVLVIATFALIGAALDANRRGWGLLAASMFFLALLPGAFPGGGVRALPAMLRPIARPDAAAPFVLLVALAPLVAVGLDRLSRWDPRAATFAAGGLAALALVAHLDRLPRTAAPPEPVELLTSARTDRMTQVAVTRPPGGDPPVYLHPTLYVMEGKGVTNALTAFRGPQRATPKYRLYSQGRAVRYNRQHRSEIRVEDRHGRVTNAHLGARVISFTATTERPNAVVAVNRNHDRDWTASLGRVVRPRGILGVRLPVAGEHHVVLRHSSGAVRIGLWITWLAVVGCLVFGGYRLKRRYRPV
ncbi:hypothetical protein K8I61_02810 [bacterium]|nr:hypothetical protein [bacterium]